ncbi:MAG: FAD binding domain-containing protein [Nocardioidaceae bacterium]
MIPSAFDYVAPESVSEALDALGSESEEIKVLAGGQSLIPVLRLRLAAPTLLVDIGRIADLQGVRDDGDALVIGALTTHHDVAHHPLIEQHAALLARAAETVADPQVRHRGTFGGALAHADPAGDMPAAVVALDAEMQIEGRNGRRVVPAVEFFSGLFTTVLAEDELLTGIRVPKHDGWGSHYEKFTRVAQQWSIVAVAAAMRVADGRIMAAKVGLTNMGPTPIRATAVERALVGQSASPDTVSAAAQHAAEGTSPPTDTNADADFRRHLSTVLTRRAVLAAVGS